MARDVGAQQFKGQISRAAWALTPRTPTRVVHPGTSLPCKQHCEHAPSARGHRGNLPEILVLLQIVLPVKALGAPSLTEGRDRKL